MPNKHTWDHYYLSQAYMVAQLSKDPATKVGAVLVDNINRSVATGYNGFPSGVGEDPEKWERPTKYEYVIHAELNAILNCNFNAFGGTIYCTLEPCHKCLAAIIQKGISRVVYYETYDRKTHPAISADLKGHILSVEQFPVNPRLDELRQLLSVQF